MRKRSPGFQKFGLHYNATVYVDEMGENVNIVIFFVEANINLK